MIDPYSDSRSACRNFHSLYSLDDWTTVLWEATQDDWDPAFHHISDKQMIHNSPRPIFAGSASKGV